MGGGGGQRQSRQPLLIDDINHPGYLADLGVRQPALPKQRGDAGHPTQRFGDPYMLPGRSRGHRTGPRQPMCYRFDIGPKPDRVAGVELTHQLQQGARRSGGLGGSRTNPTSQTISMRLVLLVSDLLRCRPIRYSNRLARIAPRYHPWSVMNRADHYHCPSPKNPCPDEEERIDRHRQSSVLNTSAPETFPRERVSRSRSSVSRPAGRALRAAHQSVHAEQLHA